MPEKIGSLTEIVEGMAKAKYKAEIVSVETTEAGFAITYEVIDGADKGKQFKQTVATPKPTVADDTVWIIEHRQQHLDVKLPRKIGGGTYDENVVMHVASSKEAAIAWCQLPDQLKDEKDERKPWWYAISCNTVDAESIVEDHDLTFVYWDGMVGRYQPVYGYEAMYVQMKADKGRGVETDTQKTALQVGKHTVRVETGPWHGSSFSTHAFHVHGRVITSDCPDMVDKETVFLMYAYIEPMTACLKDLNTGDVVNVETVARKKKFGGEIFLTNYISGHPAIKSVQSPATNVEK